ncbi:PhnA domain-containing protein [Aquimarina mytili]|uniref:PhnA domain-containing protein n=1 Tax=Aquimarina mytili TaxID=874423 RepID=A0A936ZXV3_9FLAO|nr:alkylphosphonate utilization protein [Aquimarina mytili]MBL0683116.1 PhnA domain-containing protein [Aquimarina mytili]
MNIEKELYKRSESKCELSGTTEDLRIYAVPKSPNSGLESHILISQICLEQIEDLSLMDPNHWRCLNESMWSEVPAVQVIAWRMLNRLKNEGWPQDLLDMLYLDDETLAWAKADGDGEEDSDAIKHMDSNGVQLKAGDAVVLIKDLDVKGANFTAKRGTAVRNISLVHDNPEHIEGRVNGQHIVILTKFVKKS